MTARRVGVLPALRGAHVLVLNWRDVRHPQAGGAEQYMHQVARRWVDAGVTVTWFTSRPSGLPARERIDGVTVIRAGGTLSVYAEAAMRLALDRGTYDAIVDCQNGIPFFAPAFVRSRIPVVQVVHHVHQDQFATRFAPPMAAVGRVLEGRVARRVYGQRPIVAVSPSTREELRRRLGFSGPVHIVPNGTVDVPVLSGPRDPDPTVVVVSRLVPHKRIDLLLGHVANAATQVPRLRVEVVGDGPELMRLRGIALDLGLGDTVEFRGYVPDTVRDDLLSRAWLTTSTAEAEGWGCSVIEAAAWGVPCLALRAPGIRDSVVHRRTGWLVDGQRDFGTVMATVLDDLADEGRARKMADACQSWARCFSWDRTADLLAGVVLDQIHNASRGASRVERRFGRSDMNTVAAFPSRAGLDLRQHVRCTDEIIEDGPTTRVLLTGCDEVDAMGIMRRAGVLGATVRLGDRRDLLTGPAADEVGELGAA